MDPNQPVGSVTEDSSHVVQEKMTVVNKIEEEVRLLQE